MQQNFARSMSLADAMNPENLLCYEMNGAPLPTPNGFPLRLIAPGWYGIANVKWLKAIEVRDTRFMSLLMARDYVTIREEEHNGETVWAETSVGRARIKSAPAKVTRTDSGYRIIGAAWGHRSTGSKCKSIKRHGNQRSLITVRKPITLGKFGPWIGQIPLLENTP